VVVVGLREVQPRVARAVEVAAYCVVCEAFTNAAKHARRR
jgi:signal transduction histidine kinase